MTTPHDTHHQAPNGPAALLCALGLVTTVALMSVILYQAVSTSHQNIYLGLVLGILTLSVFSRGLYVGWLTLKTYRHSVSIKDDGIHFSKDGHTTVLSFSDPQTGYTTSGRVTDVFNDTQRFRLKNKGQAMQQLTQSYPEALPLKHNPQPAWATFVDKWGFGIVFILYSVIRYFS